MISYLVAGNAVSQPEVDVASEALCCNYVDRALATQADATADAMGMARVLHALTVLPWGGGPGSPAEGGTTDRGEPWFPPMELRTPSFGFRLARRKLHGLDPHTGYGCGATRP